MNPTSSKLVAAAEGKAVVRNCLQNRGIIAPVRGSGVPDEPFEAVLGAGELGMGARGLRLAGQPQRLTQPEPRIAVVGSGLERGAKMLNGRRGVAFTQGQPAAELAHQGRSNT